MRKQITYTIEHAGESARYVTLAELTNFLDRILREDHSEFDQEHVLLFTGQGAALSVSLTEIRP